MLAGNQDILQWLVWTGPTSIEELATYYRTWRREDGDGGREIRLAVEERTGGRLAGSIALRLGPPGAPGDVGYWIGTGYQGRGLGGEALALAARLAFRHLEASALEARVFAGNDASRRILERCGFTHLRTLRSARRPGAEPVDQWQFVLLRPEWRRLGPHGEPREERVEWEPDQASGGALLDAFF
jgi:ribosomal-protein-alanine N-acetyltransferase